MRAQGDKSLGLRDDLVRILALLGDREAMARESESLLADTPWTGGVIRNPKSPLRPLTRFSGTRMRPMPHIERSLAPSQQGLTSGLSAP